MAKFNRMKHLIDFSSEGVPLALTQPDRARNCNDAGLCSEARPWSENNGSDRALSPPRPELTVRCVCASSHHTWSVKALGKLCAFFRGPGAELRDARPAWSCTSG